MSAQSTEFRPSKLSEEELEIARKLAARFVALRASTGMTRAEFAIKYEVPGGASMITQNTKGKRPISLAQAKAYARGFGCSLFDISPLLAADLPSSSVRDALPSLGDRYASADETTRKLIDIALLEEDADALRQLSPSIVAMVRMVKAAIAAENKPNP